MNTNAPLTADEAVLFNKHEAVIRAGKNTFVIVGQALTEIRDKRLYRREFQTFDDYCEKRWGWTRQRASQLVEAAAVVQQLPAKLSTMVDSERVARELAKVPQLKRVEVAQAAIRNGEITAKSVTIAAKAAVVEAVRMDSVGRKIPKEILSEWDRAVEMARELCSAVSKVKVTVEKGISAKDIIFVELSNGVVDDAAQLRYSLAQISPYAVCTLCQGRVRENCQLCRRRGWISKFMWDSSISRQEKALIQKHAEEQKSSRA